LQGNNDANRILMEKCFGRSILGNQKAKYFMRIKDDRNSFGVSLAS
jgi:hypothetical protein